MWKPRLSRIGALFFAVIIAAGGSGLPVVDAAFHHLSGTTGSSQLVNPAAQSHDAVCTLGVPLPVAAASSGITGGERFVAPVTCPVAPLHAVPRANALPLLRLPRAPPAPLA